MIGFWALILALLAVGIYMEGLKLKNDIAGYADTDTRKETERIKQKQVTEQQIKSQAAASRTIRDLRMMKELPGTINPK